MCGVATGAFVIGVLATWGSWFAFGEWETSKLSQREIALSNRLEGVKLTCKQLSTVGPHGPISIGKDVVTVDVGTEYVHVIGYNIEANLPPVTSWWGSDRAELKRQVCAQVPTPNHLIDRPAAR